MQRSTWRILSCEPAGGAWNMAVDEAVLESVTRGDSRPVLRLYRWQPPCLSLGYSQPVSDVDLLKLKESGWEMVRRPTGGRAILHTDELTYAVIAPLTEERAAGTLLESYQRLSQALLRALQLLQVRAEVQGDQTHPSPAAQADPAICFERPSSYEITVNNKKLIGSAQSRRYKGVLQHGSLPLSGDLARITRVLAYPDEAQRLEAAARIKERAATVESALGRPLSWEEAAWAFERAFQETLALDFEPGKLTSAEQQRAIQLVQEKYANPAWTMRLA